MISGRTRAIILAALGALLANAQCYVNCAITNCTQTPCNSCPRHHSSHGDLAGCQHQHSEFTGPQLRIAVGNITTAVAGLAPCAAAESVFREPVLLSLSTNSSPPSSQLSPAISVLRI